MAQRMVGVCLLAGSAVLSCGGESSSSVPNVDSSKGLVALSPGDQQSLCDWVAQLEGGYGHVTRCDAGPFLTAPMDQAMCISVLIPTAAMHPNCTTTIGQYVPCVQWLLANWCTSTLPPVPDECKTVQAQCFDDVVPMGSSSDAGTD